MEYISFYLPTIRPWLIICAGIRQEFDAIWEENKMMNLKILQVAEEKGIEQGIEQGIKEMVLKLKQAGVLTPEQISQISGLSIDEVKML